MSDWYPYIIPATPTIPLDSDEVYALSCEAGADGSKNPSQFLRWRSGLPRGQELGDILYWDPNVGPIGSWVVLDAPQDVSESNKKVLEFGDEIGWKDGLPVGTSKGDLLYWDPSAGENGKWAVLSAPTQEGSIIYWDGEEWKFLQPPTGTVLHALTIQSGNIAWTETEDCQ